MRVAFIGLGVMGYHMAGHLVAKGHQVTVYNRTASKAEQWVAAQMQAAPLRRPEGVAPCARSPPWPAGRGIALPSLSRRWTGWLPGRPGGAGYSKDTCPEPVRLTARWCGLPATTMSPDPVSATLAASDA